METVQAILTVKILPPYYAGARVFLRDYAGAGDFENYEKNLYALKVFEGLCGAPNFPKPLRDRLQSQKLLSRRSL